MYRRAEARHNPENSPLERVIRGLNELDRSAGWKRTVAIGELLLDTFFGGSAEAWHDHRRTKDYSIRWLAEQPNCPLAKTALNQALAVYAVSRQLPWVLSSARVTPSHVAAVLGLTVEDQDELLRAVERDGRGVRWLKTRALDLRRRGVEPRSRSAVRAAEKALNQLRAAERLLGEAQDLLTSNDDVEKGTRDELTHTVRRLRDTLGEVSDLAGPTTRDTGVGNGATAQLSS